MASYHSSFTYRDKNSWDEGLIIVAFDPDIGFQDTFLSMDNISDDYYDGTKKFNYSAKYNSSAEIQIAVIKKDGTDMTVKEFRKYAKWLTGARTDTWLDMYVSGAPATISAYTGDGKSKEFKLELPYSIVDVKINGEKISAYIRKFANDPLGNIPSGTLIFDEAPAIGASIEIFETPPIYSFLGKFTNFEQYKYDARTVGFKLTFSATSPWAFSAPQINTVAVGSVLDIDVNGVVISRSSNIKLACSNYGVVSISGSGEFSIDDGGVVYIDNSESEIITNESDDLYSYVYLDLFYVNTGNSDELTINIKNESFDTTTRISGIANDDIVVLSSKQFIMAYDGNMQPKSKIFGDNFNFVWPKLGPGDNKFIIDGAGSGYFKFVYRYPMKIGNCTIDIDVNGNVIDCGCSEVDNDNTQVIPQCNCTVNEADLRYILDSILK